MAEFSAEGIVASGGAEDIAPAVEVAIAPPIPLFHFFRTHGLMSDYSVPGIVQLPVAMQ